MSKVLPIAKAFYLDYFLLFLFNNATSYFIYANNALHIRGINESLSDKKTWLYNGQYIKNII